MDFKTIEKKWQDRWEKEKAFEVVETSKKKKYYCLEMYPYPSGSGLHMGHVCNYTIGDVYARYKRMNGFNVLYPMGYDSFGLPAENAAIKEGVHPKKFIDDIIKEFIKQQKALGLSYDWSRMLYSHDPEYYKWNQWFFLKLMEKGLIYRKKARVNWCGKCNTVLANEQVHNGKCWRHEDTEVEEKKLEQWFIKTTKYKEELLEDIKKLKWPERIKLMQENWIGRSEGANIIFKLKDSDEKIEAFTTRVDTFYGMTFIVVAPEHPKVLEWVKGTKYEKEVKEFIERVKKLTNIERTTTEKKEKRGVFLGRYAIHPLTGNEVPIYAADFVLHEYGTGIVQAVPAHDQRDFDFAKEYNLPIVVSVNPEEELDVNTMKKAFEGYGILTNSDEFTGLKSDEALVKITDKLENLKAGKRTVQYKLKDWLVSRQRYWGTPIPVIHCDDCGISTVEEEDLPILLPENVKFGQGNPLETNEEFLVARCPKCHKAGRRETDTMDTFFDSSWYYMRYCDNKNKDEPFNKKKANYWMPIDQYIGGAEHACMHLIYARFFTKALRDMGLLEVDEPFTRLFNQGMLHKDGAVMSKSKGNVVLPEEISEKYGIDTGRLFLMFVASPEKDREWDDKRIQGSIRFIKKFLSLYDKKIGEEDVRIESRLHKLVKDFSENIEGFKYNIAIVKLMDFVNHVSKEEKISKNVLEDLLKMISVFCPHIAEELWEKIGHKNLVSLEKWPLYDESKIDLKLEALDAMIHNVTADIGNVLELVKIKAGKVTIAVSEKWKYNVFEKLDKITSRNFKEVLPNVINLGNKEQIVKIVKGFCVNKLNLGITSQEDELEILRENMDFFKEEFKLDVDIIVSDKVDHEKAKNALPGKPAIIIS